MHTSPRPQLTAASEGGQVDLREALAKLETDIGDLRVKYEQYFAGYNPFPPEKEHALLKRAVRFLRKAPFKSSAQGYRLRMLEQRYNTLNTYWQRVLREREEGTYQKDVFKADLRERFAAEDQYAQTERGISERGMQQLFHTYKQALERSTGKAQQLDFGAFQRSIVSRVKNLQAQNGGKKFSFKVVVTGGKVTLKAKIKE